ncbi:uncharacterized protein LOC106577978, partial [Arapaima gigas]
TKTEADRFKSQVGPWSYTLERSNFAQTVLFCLSNPLHVPLVPCRVPELAHRGPDHAHSVLLDVL